jgi:wingless-type MMTV integration site family protein 6
MGQFNEIAIRLKERFDGAAKVIASNDGKSFAPFMHTIKPPSRQDLIYTDESPDFCRPNIKTGSLGTHSRQCNDTSIGVDGCNLMCCGRGFKRSAHLIKYNCKCVFEWCSRNYNASSSSCFNSNLVPTIKCQLCSQTRLIHTCL